MSMSSARSQPSRDNFLTRDLAPVSASSLIDDKACLLDFMSPVSGRSERAVAAGSRSGDGTRGAAIHIVRCDQNAASGPIRPTSRADALTICVAISGAGAHAASSDECSFIAPPRQAGEVTIYDRRYRWRFEPPEPVDCILFHIPRDIFEHMSANVSLAWSDTVPGLFTGGRADEALGYLAMATWSSFEHAAGFNMLLVDHLAASVLAHVIKSYGVAKPAAAAQGGLGPWREAQVRDLVGRHLHEPLPLAAIAKACKLSTSHFAREFKTSFGCSPHQWVRLQRLERAKHLIRTTTETLSEIAVASGFADQSRMTRIFSRQERVSPAAWRRRSTQRGAVLKDTDAEQVRMSGQGVARRLT
jgi:AraC family transcriptional regulator